MSADSQIVIGKLKSHIEQIISKYELAISVNAQLQESLEKVTKELETKNIKIAELSSSINVFCPNLNSLGATTNNFYL